MQTPTYMQGSTTTTTTRCWSAGWLYVCIQVTAADARYKIANRTWRAHFCDFGKRGNTQVRSKELHVVQYSAVTRDPNLLQLYRVFMVSL